MIQFILPLLLGPLAPLPSDQLLFPASHNFDDSFLSVNGAILNGTILIQNGRLTSAHRHATPLEIEYRIKTDSTNIRLGYAAHEIIFNWEVRPSELRIGGGPAGGRHVPAMGAVPAGQFVTIRQVVRGHRMEIYVDDQLRAEWLADFSAVNEPIRIFSSETLQIRSVRIRPLQPSAPGITRTRSRSAALHLPGELSREDRAQLHRLDARFDPSRDWRLQLDMLPGDVNGFSQILFLWGDRRPGKDTLYIRQRGRALEVGGWANPAPFVTSMLPEDRLGSWIRVEIRYDSARHRISLSFDGDAVAETPAGMLYFDRPMPIYLGQAHGTQRFGGRLRNLTFENS